MTTVHNVSDRIGQWIGPRDIITGIDISRLTDADKGRGVVYTPKHGDREYGKLSSWNDRYIFVRFTTGDTAAACDPETLHFEHAQ